MVVLQSITFAKKTTKGFYLINEICFVQNTGYTRADRKSGYPDHPDHGNSPPRTETMYPNDKPGSSQSDPEIRVAETFISSMLAHYFQFEEALGMNVARGAVTQNMTHSYGLQKNPLVQESREKHLPAG